MKFLSYSNFLLEKAKSEAQQKLFGMALAVRRGELSRNKVTDKVLDIVDSDITNKEIEDFASTKHKDIPKKVGENVTGNNTPGMGDVSFPGSGTGVNFHSQVPGSGDFPVDLDARKIEKKKKRKRRHNNSSEDKDNK